MLNTVDLNSNDTNGLFLRYFWPALLSVVIKSVLIMVDGIFIGQGVGPLGLAAVGMTMPLQAIFTALAIMVGVGGAALMSMEFGKGRISAGQSVFSQALVLTLLGAVVLVIAGFVWMDSILQALGAEGALLALASDYLPVMLIFFLFHALVIITTVSVINDSNPLLPMISMALGAVASIGLGYLFIFVFQWGIKGAGYASVAAQIVMLVVLGWHFVARRGHLRLTLAGLTFDRVREILHIGSPIFLLELATIATMLIFNYILLNQYSDQHMAAYSITMNLGLVLIFFLSSIGQACQPVLSYCYGQERADRVRDILRLGLIYSVVMGAVAMLLVLFNTPWLVQLYIDDQPQVQALAVDATRLYFAAAVLMGINLLAAIFFQSIHRPNLSTLVSLSRGFIGVLVGLVILPTLFPAQGIWSLTLAAELMTCLLSIALLRHYLRQPVPVTA